MKAKLKDGRTLPIEKNSVIALDNNGETMEVNVEDIESLGTPDIDWEQRRYEIAKAAMQGILSNERRIGSLEDTASCSVMYTDALIEELKKKKQ